MTLMERRQLEELSSKTADEASTITQLVDAGNAPPNAKLTLLNMREALACLQAVRSALQG